MKSPYVPLSEAARQSVRNERAGTVKKLSAEEAAAIRRRVTLGFLRDDDRYLPLIHEPSDGEALEARTATGVHRCAYCFRELEDPQLCLACGPIEPMPDNYYWPRRR